MDNKEITLPEGYELVELAETDRAEFIGLSNWVFPTAVSVAEKLEAPDEIFWDRTPGIRTISDGQLAAIHSSIPWERFSIPGAFAKVSGLTEVAVHPEHRRRGLLSAMIKLHLTRCAQRGELLSILTATEPVIYGRFGYGRAADSLSLNLSRGAALRSVEGSDEVDVSVLELDIKRDADLSEAIHHAAGSVGPLKRSGWAERVTPGYREAVLFEQKQHRMGKEPKRLMLAKRDGQAVGYALFNRTDVWDTWSETGPASSVAVQECVAVDAGAAHALWSRLLDLDLTAKVSIEVLPIDDALIGMLVDVGAAKAQLAEMLWVRLVDLPGALTTRQYSADLDVVLAVSDALLPGNSGRWHLTATAFNNSAQVEPTEAEPDVTLDIRELGAAYLGGTSLAALAASGLVVAKSPEALLRTASAFQWPLAPGCNWHF